MAGETELKQMVVRIIDLGRLLAEAERQDASEKRREPKQSEQESPIDNVKRASPPHYQKPESH